jgi:NtrC-family two-component system sensor histidine kinase KinB
VIQLGLRTRFLLSGAILVLTTVASGVFCALAFARLSAVVGETVRDTEQTTAATATVANALEREDDALLLWLSGNLGAEQRLASERSSVEEAFARLSGTLTKDDERIRAAVLRRDIDAYHAAGDDLVRLARQPDGQPGGLDVYHLAVNPLLRRAVGDAGGIRDEHFRSTQAAALWARDEARRATGIVAGISLGALILSVIVAFRLARRIVWPLRQLAASVEAVRQGDFERRVEVRHGDELGRLAEDYNRMAAHLAELRRANIGEVLRAKETLEATLAALPDAVVVVEADGTVASMNAVALTVLGYPGAPRSSAGHAPNGAPIHASDLPLPDEAKAALRAALEGKAEDDAAIRLDRAVGLTRDGRERALLPRVVPVPARDSRRGGAVLVLYDVTELVRLDEMRLELIAVASHELRTPLTTMRMTLLMLQEDGAALAARQQDLLATSLLGVDQLSATVDEFLDLTRIEAGQLRLACDGVDVARVVEEALRPVKPRFEEAGVELRVQIEASVPASLWADAARLGVVLSNVLGNALKYTPQGGHVGVRVASQGKRVHIAVTDTGPGVPEEYRERIFEKFFRVEHHRGSDGEGVWGAERARAGGTRSLEHPHRERVRGSGIGLYLARQIVEAHGGRIVCEPGEDGRGTMFDIALPLGEGRAPL